jgi:iron complex transport system substrate-binding protein
MRIVSLACSNTEIVHALGCAHLLVGVDEHSDWPESVVGPLPKLGPDLNPDLDAVQALKPDLVLATLTVPGHEQVVEQLEARGLPFIAPEPVSLDDVYRDIIDIAQRLGVEPRGHALVQQMRATMEGEPATSELATSLPPATVRRRPRIVVQWWPKPVFAPGRLSWVHDLLEAAGADHPLAGEAVKSRALSDDEIRAYDPDAIVIAWCGVDPSKYRPDVVLNNPAFAETAAIGHKRVVCVPEAFLGRPGPRLTHGFTALKTLVEEIIA